MVVLASKKEQADGHVFSRVVAVLQPELQEAEEAGASVKPGKKASSRGSKATAGDGIETSEKVKWKKHASKLLKAHPKRRMKVQLLREKVLQAAGVKDDGGKLLKKLASLPEVFAICEKFVRLL